MSTLNPQPEPGTIQSPASGAPLGSPARETLSAMGSVTDLGQVFADFGTPKYEWRRLCAEFIGTFFLVLAAAGGPVVNAAIPGSVGHAAAVAAPGMMVMAIIMSFGKVSGAHLNPAVSMGFALRGDFPWSRVPGYVVMQLLGSSVAALLLQGLLGVSASHGGTYPGGHYGAGTALVMEAVLTFGLVTVVLGTASGAQSVGLVGAIGVGGYIALAGLWGSPISGASMNPARSLGPDFVSGDFTAWFAYVIGPLIGSAVAAGLAVILRGRGGGWVGSISAQGDLAIKPEPSTDPTDSDK